MVYIKNYKLDKNSNRIVVNYSNGIIRNIEYDENIYDEIYNKFQNIIDDNIKRSLKERKYFKYLEALTVFIIIAITAISIAFSFYYILPISLLWIPAFIVPYKVLKDCNKEIGLLKELKNQKTEEYFNDKKHYLRKKKFSSIMKSKRVSEEEKDNIIVNTNQRKDPPKVLVLKDYLKK